MRDRSALWDVNIGNSHALASEVTLMLKGVIVDDPQNPGTPLPPLKVNSGRVTLDRTASQMGRLSLVVAEPWLAANSQLLTPLGYELAVSRGITYSDGSTEMMALGVFPIQSASTGSPLATSITALDRSQLVKDARLEDDYSIAAGTNYSDAIRAIIEAGVPGLTYDFIVTEHVTPLLTFPVQSDRWDAATSMAKAIGAELFFNGIGTLVLRAEPSFGGVPDWTVTDGAGGVLVTLARDVDRADTYNRVIVTGSNASLDFIPRGIWTDLALESRSNYDGGFGHKPKFFDSALVTTDAQAVDAAAAIGNAGTGLASALAFDAIPNPALEPGDMVLVVRSAIGLSEIHLLDSIDIGLGASDTMNARTRALTPRVLVAPSIVGVGNVIMGSRQVTSAAGTPLTSGSGAITRGARTVAGTGFCSPMGSGAITRGLRTVAGTGTKT